MGHYLYCRRHRLIDAWACPRCTEEELERALSGKPPPQWWETLPYSGERATEWMNQETWS